MKTDKKIFFGSSAGVLKFGAEASPPVAVNVGASFDPSATTSINDWTAFTTTPTSDSGLGYATIGDPQEGSSEYQGQTQLNASASETYSDIFFCGGRVGSTWTQCGSSSTYWAQLYNTTDLTTAKANGNDKNNSAEPDFMSFVLDWSASDHPNYSTVTSSSNAAQNPYRFSFNSNWLGYGKGVAQDANEVFRDNATTSDPEYIVEGAKKTALESLLADHIAGTNGADITDVLIRAAAPSATSYFQVRCKSWTDHGDGSATLTFYQGSGINSAGTDASYFRFALYNTEVRPDPANVSLSEAGTYCIDVFNNKVYYRPASGTSPVPYKVSIPFRNNYIRAIADGVNLSVESSTICGFSSCDIGGTNPGFVNVSGTLVEGTASYDGVHSYRNGVGHSINICPGDAGGQGVTLYRSIFDTDISGVGVSPGADIQRCMFIEPQSKSCVRTNGMQPSTGGATKFTTLPKTIFKYNFGQVAFSIHGQVLSLYSSSWRHSEVFGNIFYNCEGAYSAQDSAGQYPDPGGLGTGPAVGSFVNDYTWSNNLVYHDIDRAFEYDQAGVAVWNGPTSFDQSYTAEVRNNTLINAKYDENPAGYTTDYTFENPVELSLRNANTAGDIASGSSLYVSGNIAATLEYSISEDASIVESQYDNFVGSDSGTESTLSIYDAGDIFSTIVSDGGVMDSGTTTLSSTSTAKRILAIGGSEGTVSSQNVGIQWSTNPTRQNIEAITSTRNVDWSDTYSPQVLATRVENPDLTNVNQLSSAVELKTDLRAGWPLAITSTSSLWFGELGLTGSTTLTAAIGYGMWDFNQSGADTSPLPADPNAAGFEALSSSGTTFRVGTAWRMDLEYPSGTRPAAGTAGEAETLWNAASTRTMEVIGVDNTRYTYDFSSSYFDANSGTNEWRIGPSNPSNVLADEVASGGAVVETVYNDYQNNWFAGAPTANGGTIQIAFYTS